MKMMFVNEDNRKKDDDLDWFYGGGLVLIDFYNYLKYSKINSIVIANIELN
jgi:hypothetical protein